MTTLNPSHLPIPGSSRGQAIYDPSSSRDVFPSMDMDHLSDDDDERKGRREGRKRVRGNMPPLPDLRFEQTISEKGPIPSSTEKEEELDVGLVTGAENDEVFHWGRKVRVDWGKVGWITFRDQLISPLIQGALWGWAGIFLSASSMYLRSSLFPASHLRSRDTGRVVGGGGGGVAQAGGGEVVGSGQGWWRRWVKSFAGGLETSTTI
ncbi:hypothetical protein TREMEDRAFT_30372 [Tremella mesenterica DSM 1558]|uniref:uncharacterized protein n=1 Tax=Tremella mesenterica (strain ATCC 24925 / CBS 8224 / DSM 1558 / NBRC 9311 / NRRL Y-6157 / RJB 2259-6 / UBC 559-6) TaxID=578456 RepID=UPI0003F49E43|nr:uncharacterized protein TREMEDRAFT_30372 [Tremella mesenterica DSM 1558]EIW69556.1 hypothetical protein TREMEDRAFT_30372 [Tremella mesenterica DSM 1558]